MKLITDIQIIIGKRMLLKETSSLVRNRELFNLTTTTSAGILYEASNTEDFELIKKYVSYLKEHRIKVKTIGYFSQKKIPQLTFSKREYDFFTKKETNWYLKPVPPFAEQFVKQEFDLLIDLNIHDYFPLHYLAAASNAKFKIGKYSDENKNIYDMMIEIDRTKNLKYFLRQVDVYLQMLNKKSDGENS